jgi:hypothetical protein
VLRTLFLLVKGALLLLVLVSESDSAKADGGGSIMVATAVTKAVRALEVAAEAIETAALLDSLVYCLSLAACNGVALIQMPRVCLGQPQCSRLCDHCCASRMSRDTVQVGLG